MRRACANHLERSHRIDPENALEGLRILRIPVARARKTGDARIVHERVDPAPTLHCTRNQRFAVGVIRNIAAHQQGLRTRRLTSNLRLTGLGLAARIIDQDAPPPLRQHQRGGSTDAGTGSGDQGNPGFLRHLVCHCKLLLRF